MMHQFTRLARAAPIIAQTSRQTFASVHTAISETAGSALKKSCYLKIDFKISEESPVYDMLQRMAAHNIGCLAVTEGNGASGRVVGVVSERDYLKKVALLGRSSKNTKVSEICTHGRQNLVVADLDEPVADCMRKMINRDMRHLLICDNKGDVVGMLSVKDLVKEIVAQHKEVVQRLTDFAIGKGAFYGSD